MTYTGDGETSAIYRREGDVEELQIGATTARFVAPGSLTDGNYGLFKWEMGANSGGAGGHFHRTFSESFYILSGVVELYNGETWIEARANDYLYVPPGGVHGFRKQGDEPASMLILFAPGPPREIYFRELAEIIASGRELSRDEWVEFWARHDQYPVEEA